MNINKMNKKIKILKRSLKNDIFEEEKYEEVKLVWSSINNLKRTEKYNKNNILINVKNIEFITRYYKSFENLEEQSTVIEFNNKFYDVYSIDNMYFDNKYIIFRATEMGE